MKEIFNNISQRTKEQVRFWVNVALTKENPMDAAKVISNFSKTLKTEEEQSFLDFYFNMRLLQLKEDEEQLNENHSN
jgi:predicted solute-binding protein